MLMPPGGGLGWSVVRCSGFLWKEIVMKRLVTIALILVLAQAANARIALVAYDAAGTSPLPGGGSVIAMPGGIITIKLISTDGASGGILVDAIDDGAALGVASDLFVAPASSPISGGYLENTESPMAGISGCLVSYVSYAADPPIAAGATLMSFHYQVSGVVTSLGVLAAGTSFLSSDTFTYVAGPSIVAVNGANQPIEPLIIIPEPMTLGLLGLGGLFLRRRLA
jgi:hypothetical protein